LAAAASTPFEVADSLGDATKMMPTELRCFMAHEFAVSQHDLFRDTVPLILLAEEQPLSLCLPMDTSHQYPWSHIRRSHTGDVATVGIGFADTTTASGRWVPGHCARNWVNPSNRTQTEPPPAPSEPAPSSPAPAQPSLPPTSPELTAHRLIRTVDLPIAWAAQTQLLGLG
jgi:hypothetical protein